MPSRRDFLKKSAVVPLAAGMAGMTPMRIKAHPRRVVPEPGREPVQLALIGFGPWGRELADTLARLPEAANLTAVCDTYEVMRRRATRDVPGIATHEEYRAVLDDPAIQAVVIATPTHAHRQIALDALAAGKHVYCEAPLAASIDDARAIAQAAQAAEDTLVFQAGLQTRFDPQYQSVNGFIRTGALGRVVMGRAQWHAKNSWRRPSPNRAREVAINWRLDPALTTGLIGEEGIHQIDAAMWIFKDRPTSVSGFGQIMLWDDGRTIPDTLQAVFAFPGGQRLLFDATLASSFDARYELFYGSDSTIMLRDSKAWMFKEVDAPSLGWEVYARKDKFYKEEGIALVANATKLDAQSVDPTEDDPNMESPHWYALRDFLDNVQYGPFPSSAGYQQGFEAAVVALKSHEATMNNTTIPFEDDWFAL